MEAEPIEVHDVAALPWAECLPNLSWLIPLARYTHDLYLPVVAHEEEATDADWPRRRGAANGGSDD
jgi:hypothetical protein